MANNSIFDRAYDITGVEYVGVEVSRSGDKRRISDNCASQVYRIRYQRVSEEEWVEEESKEKNK